MTTETVKTFLQSERITKAANNNRKGALHFYACGKNDLLKVLEENKDTLSELFNK